MIKLILLLTVYYSVGEEQCCQVRNDDNNKTIIHKTINTCNIGKNISLYDKLYNYMYHSGDCKRWWVHNTLKQLDCDYTTRYINNLETHGIYSYPNETETMRMLYLGDSISHGIYVYLQHYARNSPIKIHKPITNCRGFETWDQYLEIWLGSCQWDIIGFNIGFHYHNNTSEYRFKLEEIIRKLKYHSPYAAIYFSTTTPSPNDISPPPENLKTCKNYNKLDKRGRIYEFNRIATNLCKEKDVIVNNRYGIINTNLSIYQNYCDVHFNSYGYKIMAHQEWSLISALINTY